MKITRREFAGLAVSALAVGGHADPMGYPIGCQTYPVRQALAKDFPGTLKELAAIGYKTIEMCSPPGYNEYRPLANLSASEMKKIITDAGLRCESCHYNMREFKENLDERVAFAKELGLKQMILASMGTPRDAKLSDWSRAAGELNTAAEKAHKAGLQMGFHNHDGEFQQLEGTLIYDKLMSELDPKLVKMQFQVSVIHLGFEAATYLTKYPGRIISLHLQDWSSKENKQVAIGQGMVEWKKLFAAAKKGGVKNYFVEMNMELMKTSYPYLHELKA